MANDKNRNYDQEGRNPQNQKTPNTISDANRKENEVRNEGTRNPNLGPTSESRREADMRDANSQAYNVNSGRPEGTSDISSRDSDAPNYTGSQRRPAAEDQEDDFHKDSENQKKP